MDLRTNLLHPVLVLFHLSLLRFRTISGQERFKYLNPDALMQTNNPIVQCFANRGIPFRRGHVRSKAVLLVLGYAPGMETKELARQPILKANHFQSVSNSTTLNLACRYNLVLKALRSRVHVD